MDIPPSQTIYVQNLYEKLPKEGAHPACVEFAGLGMSVDWRQACMQSEHPCMHLASIMCVHGLTALRHTGSQS